MRQSCLWGRLIGGRSELVDKFAWHLPLYRQHQRLAAMGITVSRQWLTQLVQASIALLVMIYNAQLDSIRRSRVKAMDETPIKAGRTGHGGMKQAYFWPVYGDQDEVCFPFHPSRRAEHVREVLGLDHAAGSVLLSDGYAAYESFAKKVELVHAQCWAFEPRHPDQPCAGMDARQPRRGWIATGGLSRRPRTPRAGLPRPAPRRVLSPSCASASPRGLDRGVR